MSFQPSAFSSQLLPVTCLADSGQLRAESSILHCFEKSLDTLDRGLGQHAMPEIDHMRAAGELLDQTARPAGDLFGSCQQRSRIEIALEGLSGSPAPGLGEGRAPVD